MPALPRRPLAAATFAALALGASVGVTHAAGPDRPVRPATHGVVHLATQVNLPRGVWTDVPLQVVLPKAGTYELDADVRGRLAGSPAVNTYITARLWNVTAGAEVPQSERLVYQVIDLNAGTAQAGGNATAPISELVTVTGPTTIALQAIRNDAAGSASIAQIYSDGSGYTSLRFDRVAP
jgi:hypothetical protein